MKLFPATTIVFVCCLLLCPMIASAEEPLTNSAVERMVAAGLSPEIITAKIKGSMSNFDVSIDALVQLKNNGIDKDIIMAMVEAGGTDDIAPGSRDEDDQRRLDPNAQLLQNIEEATALKEKKDYTWKTKAHAIAATLKSIYPSNTHNIKYWWAYSQYSALVENEHHILKGIKKVLYFDANHEDALILKGDTLFSQAKRMYPSDDDKLGESRDDVADDAQQAYRTALGLPSISPVKKSKIYYQLAEIAEEIDKSKTKAQELWQKAMAEDPQGLWGQRAAANLGVEPPLIAQDQPPVTSSLD